MPRVARRALVCRRRRPRAYGAEPKRLPSKYFYDDVGSALFDAITRLPEYYLTRAETEILSDWGWQIVRLLDAPVDFFELGSGSAIKTRLLIGEALRVQTELRYSPDRHLDRGASRVVARARRELSRRCACARMPAIISTCSDRTRCVSERKMLAMLHGLEHRQLRAG